LDPLVEQNRFNQKQSKPKLTFMRPTTNSQLTNTTKENALQHNFLDELYTRFAGYLNEDKKRRETQKETCRSDKGSC
jgi:hypothetical protein